MERLVESLGLSVTRQDQTNPETPLPARPSDDQRIHMPLDCALKGRFWALQTAPRPASPHTTRTPCRGGFQPSTGPPGTGPGALEPAPGARPGLQAPQPSEGIHEVRLSAAQVTHGKWGGRVRESARLGARGVLQCQSGGGAVRGRGAWETEAPKGSPRGEGGHGSRWQRGAMDAAATHLPAVHPHDPPLRSTRRA